MATTTATTEVAQQSRISLKGPGLESGPYGERLCVHVADELARQNPDRIYATITNSSHDIEHGFRDVTIKQFTNAVNYASWDIESRFGKSEDGVFEVIAYIGTPDIRYSIYFYAAIKTGHQVRSLRSHQFVNVLTSLVHDPFGPKLIHATSRRLRGVEMYASPAHTQLQLGHLPDQRTTVCLEQPFRPRSRHPTQHTKRTLRIHKNLGRSKR